MELLDRTSGYLDKHGVASPRLTAELMLADALGKSRLQLYMSYDQAVEEPVLERLRPLVKRRGEGEPLEYVLGATTFAGARFTITPDVLIPRPETEILLEAVAAQIDPAGRPVLDVGTGSGVLAISLARKFPGLDVHATDVCPAALALARRNDEGLENLYFHVGDLLEIPALPERFQVVVANLPYIPTAQLATLMREVQREPRQALDGGVDGLDVVRRLVTQAAGRTGRLALELGDGQAADAKTLCERAGFALIRILPDLTDRERILVAETHG